MNDNLRYALAAARLTATDVAAALAVDPKTVSRWLQGRVPYPRHRWAVADLLHVDEADLWPEIAPRHQALAEGVRAIYPHRWAVPQAVWRNHFSAARREIGILAYSALFLAEDRAVLDALTARAKADVKVRILLGDPEGEAVAQRGADEGIGAEVMAARVMNALALFRPPAPGPRGGDPASPHRALQLHLPGRRRTARQHPRLRHASSRHPGHAPHRHCRRRASNDLPHEHDPDLGHRLALPPSSSSTTRHSGGQPRKQLICTSSRAVRLRRPAARWAVAGRAAALRPVAASTATRSTTAVTVGRRTIVDFMNENGLHHAP
ncbi:hypothetical protein ACFSTC_60685 [Nonomuraea ferruginea]